MAEFTSLPIETDMNIKQLRVEKPIMSLLGIESYQDVTIREDKETGDIFIFSSSRMAAEIEKLEQLRGTE